MLLCFTKTPVYAKLNIQFDCEKEGQMALIDDYNLIYRIAKMYFLDGLSQVETAKATGLSRATVCRALEAAKSSGMVSVSLHMPASAKPDSKTAQRLCASLGLKEVILAPTCHDDETSEGIELLSHDVTSVAAAHLPRLLADSRMIGLAWGRTVYNTALHLPPVRDGARRLFVPLISNFSSCNSYLQTSSIVARFGDVFSARGYYLNISPKERSKGERTPEEAAQIRQLAVYWDALDSAIVSFSSPDNLTGYEYCGDLWKKYAAETDPRDNQMCFESMAQVFYQNGSYYSVNQNFDIVAIDLQRLREIQNVICVAAGKKKAKALIYAAKGGFYNTLILDTPTAEEMLSQLKNGEKPC